MNMIEKYLLRRGFIKGPKPVNKAAGFMELEADGYIGGRADSQKVADYGTFVQTYRALPWLYAAVTALAVAASKPVLRVYREVKGGKGEDGEPEVEQQEIQGTELNRLLELPNPWLSHRELRQVTVINLALAGNAYWNMVGRSKIKPVVISKKNPPAELWWMKPSQVEPLTSKLGELEGYCYTSPMGKEQTLSASEVIHFRQVNPDSYHVGLGIMEPLTNTATLEFNAVTFQKKYLENDGTPPFIFEHPGEPSPDELKRFWSAWDARHKGTKNAGRSAMVWGGMKTTKVGESMKDAQYVELRKMNREEILAGVGVPPSIVGLLEYANYSNMEVQSKKFWEDAVQPMLDLIADKLTLTLAPHFDERVWFEFDYSGIKALQEDEVREAQVAETWIRTGVYSPNEIRKRRNEQPYDGGDVYYLPMGLIPVGGKDYREPEPRPVAPQPAISPADDQPQDPPQDPPDDPPADPEKGIVSCSCAGTPASSPFPPVKSYWTDPERAKQLWGAFEKRVGARERSMIPQVERYLRQQAVHVKRRLSKFDSLAGVRAADLFDADKEAKLYVDKFLGHYQETFADAGEAGVRATKGLLHLGETKDAAEFHVTQEQLAKLLQQIEEAAQFFNDTTWEKVKADIEAAKLAGDTVEELAQDLWEHLDELSTSRARLISRTEMARVENWGGTEGYRQNEYVNKKGWLCSFVADSRQSHMDANEQEVGLDESFIVDGEQLEYPGDPSGSAGNSCNCLCTTYPIVDL